jgi:hypothetical protein
MRIGRAEGIPHSYMTRRTHGTFNLKYIIETYLIWWEFSHWDTWVGPKKPTLLSVRLHKDADNKWVLGDEFINVLKDTKHVGVRYLRKD